jgi:uncharacterized protein YfaS (alpha-2-macroglobulin family)/TolA-binding protein
MIAVAALCTVAVLAAPWSLLGEEKPGPGFLDRARASLLSRDYAAAQKTLKEYLQARPKYPDEGLFLLARAYALAGDVDRAVTVLDQLVSQHPKSGFRIRALLAKADILVARGRTEEGLRIYEQQARRVTSDARRLDMARVYLRFADTFFKPEDEVKKPDYGRANLFYAKAMEMGLPRDREAEVVEKRAEALSKLRKFRDAARLLASWRQANPGHAKDGALAFAQGEARLAVGDRTGARRLFRDLLASAPGPDLAAKALFGVARSFRLPSPASAVDLELGVKALRDLQTRFPAHELAPKAALQTGASYMHLKRYDEAGKELERFLDSALARPGVEEVPQAKELLGHCHYLRKAFPEAIQVWRRFLADHPAHGLWTRVQRQVIDAEYAIGAEKYAGKAYAKAKEAWDRFLEAHPLDGRCRRILLLYGKGDHESKAFEQAVAHWEKLVSKYPRTNEASEGLFRIGKTLEEDLKKFAEALKAYRKLDFGPFAHKARARIASLEKKEMRLSTERIFLTNETPQVKVVVRNIKALEFRAWSVDLESYFRKMHTASGVESLDVPLIEPDRAWKIELKGYEPYREIEREIPLPFEGGGVWAVNCTGGDLEATTVVVRSDLALIVKGSRKNLLVFGQDMRTHKPVSGVKVIVSDGEKILLESETGQDGVLLAEPEGIAAAASVRVLGAHGSSWASNTLDIRRLPAAAGLSRKAYIFTDRPAYRPGDTVHLKALIREVTKGTYTFSKDAKYTIRIAHRRGQQILKAETGLSAFGTLDWSFGLPANAPLGRYRITVTNKKNAHFHHIFKVIEYTTPKLDVDVKVENPVCYRGEKVKGKVAVTTFYGEPAPGRKIEIGFGHLPMLTGETDEKGERTFLFDTREFPESKTVRLWARIPAEGVQGSANVHISVTGFTLTLKTLREVYITNENFDLEVRTTDIAGKPVSVPLSVGIYRLEEEEGRVSEVPVKRIPVTTDEGVRKATLCLAKGGKHLLRARGVDRFGNTVTAELRLFISGDDDEVKVRILSDREEYRLGETPLIDIHSRLESRPVLLSFEGERIFRYRVARLLPGTSPFKVTMDTTLAPNFILSASILEGSDLHEARREFRVTRSLDVSVRALDGSYSPGGTARIEVVTRDPLGRPVPAEVALAMVDSAYLSLFPRKLADPAPIFFTRREAGCGSVSTNTFSFHAVTTKVLEALQKEEERLRFKKQRAKELKSLAEYVSRAEKSKERAEAEDSLAREPQASADAEYDRRGRGQTMSRRGGGRMSDAPFQGRYWNNAIGIGGGAGGSLHKRYFQPSTALLLEDVRTGILETGFWSPRIETGPSGRTVVEIPLPANVTTWQLLAVGASKALLVGTGEGKFTAKKDLVVEMKAPRALVEGDRAKIRARVRNLTSEKVRIALTLAWTEGEGQSLGTQDLTVPPSGEGEAVFDVLAESPGDRELSLLGSAGRTRDTALERIRIHPKGTEIRRGWGGATSRERKVRIVIPERDYAWRTLSVTVGASLGSSLLEIGAPQTYDGCLRPMVTFFSPADAGLLVLAKRNFLAATGRTGEGDWERLEGTVDGAIAELAVTQKRDGGFGWTPGGASNVYATVQAVRFLARAKTGGFSLDETVLSRARAYLHRAFSGTEDNTIKAASLWALAHLRAGEFAYVNRLYRIRESLPRWAQAALALTLHRMDRAEMAKQVARLLEKSLGAEEKPVSVRDKRVEWLNRWTAADRAETLALSLLALCRALPSSARLDEGVDRLMALQSGSAWPTGKATAAAAEALNLYLTKVKTGRDRYRLALEVNGKKLTTLEMDRSAGRRTVEVPAAAFRTGENLVSFRMEGVGRYAYRIDFLGLTREEDDSQQHKYVKIRREVTPQPALVKGREVPPGFGCVDSEESQRWVNLLGHLPEGRSGLVELRYHAREPEGYIVLEESLPGGVVLQEDSVTGDFDHVERHPGRIVFFLREGARAGCIRYRVHGYLPGVYKTRPPRAWSAVDPMRLSTGETAKLTVLPAGEVSPDPFRPTPDELLARGRAAFEAKTFEEASKALTPLFERFRPRSGIFGEVARMLLFCAVELDRPKKIVKYFEILKERFGSVEIPFDKSLLIAAAYGKLGEEELALQVYQGLMEASFLKESNIAADLEDQGKFLESVAFMEKLLLDYPDLPMLVGSHFALTQSIYDHAESGAAELNRPRLIARAARMLRVFLSIHPEHPLSDQAGFSLANAYLGLKAGKMAGDLAEVLVKVHGESPFLDEFHYIASLAYFRAHAWDRALRHAEKVATGRFVMPDGAKGDSPKKHLATYIMGQIHHAQGDFAKAAEHYEKVGDRFADARAALEQFKWKRLFLPEVTTFRTGEGIEVKVTHRNVKGLKLLVYPVDLMKLYLMRKNLDKVASVNLAGIKPFHAQEADLGSGREYKDHETTVTLPVKKDGAYLVVAKGKGIEASGLVLVSSLKLEVQEDTNSGRLRVTVRNETSGLFEEDAHVKVVGSESGEFVAGDTDLRGVFEAGSLIGTATVVVKKKTSYAFFRGESVHRPLEAVRRRAARGAALFGRPAAGKAPVQSLALGQPAESQFLLEQELDQSNRDIQKRNVRDLKALTRVKQKGMQAKQARRK